MFMGVCNDHVLLSRIEQCHEEDDRIRRENELQEEIRANYETLTPRERQVMELLFRGNSNKEVARALGISPKTVEIHRANVMDKMNAGSVAELVQMAIVCGVEE